MNVILYKSHLLGATMDLTQRRIYFWGGIFSQWARADFKIGDDTFNCAEQAMMAAKANLFGDDDAYGRIMACKDPRDMKAIGRTIKNYDHGKWSAINLDVVTEINYKKFSHNPAWKELLIYTDGYELVEASPYDKIWGVGLGEDDPNILDKSKWDGTNLLGKAIIAARDKIIDEL
tara:strand:- start:2065 stop:2589 length:525 start_codon:yes stop_codon:yes gene_type:complete